MILITRPLEQGRKTKYLLKVKGFEAICCPMFKVVEEFASTIESSKAVIITSQNAVPFLVRYINKNTKIFAVGYKTRNIIRSCGFKNVSSFAINAVDLLEEIKMSTERRFLYLRGNKVAHDLKTILKTFDIEVIEHIAYNVTPILKLNKRLLSCLEEGIIDRVLFYSANTANIFAERTKSLNLSKTDAICISNKTASPIKHISWKNIIIAKMPDEKSLIDKL